MRPGSLKNILKKISTLIISFLFFPTLVFASCNYSDFEGWKDCFIKEKLSLRQNSVSIEALRPAQFLPRVIELDRKQPEKQLSFAQYKDIIKIKNKIERGQKFYNDNRELADTISQEYGVEPEVLVALLGIESDYGANQGKFNIIDSLASLSFEGRRKAFFEKELLHVLTIASSENLEYSNFQGSWAGAMGQCQFMPSSYLSFAVDYDQDGVKDIWNSKADALASAANYLSRSGWKEDASHIKYINNGAHLQEKCGNSTDCLDKNDLKLIFLKNYDKITDTYAVGKNYNVLLKWNRSSYFALSVLTIAEKIRMGA
jgi:membrane-bound lytic murein transglycosylase B